MSWNFETRENEHLSETVKRLFDYCSNEYRATDDGCNTIYDEWWSNKGSRFDEDFKNLPGFDAKNHCIVIDTKRIREVDTNAIDYFVKIYLKDMARNIRQYNIVDGKTKSEWYEEYITTRDINGYIEWLRNRCPSVINYHTAKEICDRYSKALNTWNNMREYTEESTEKCNNIMEFVNIFKYIHKQYIDEIDAEEINEKFPSIKAREGMKTSKLVLKCARLLDITNDFNWEREFARYADAINPLEIHEKVIISWNLLDYLTMSFGNSWTSCHSIDKENRHGYTGHAAGYRGCYSSGCLSYALDSTSIVVYSVDEKVKDFYWNAPKIRRQMFHIYKDGTSFVQGRLYPDDQGDCGNSVEFNSYKAWRDLMQTIIAKAYDFPNLWKNKKGTSDCEYNTETWGTHYSDYTSYSNCNISFTGDEPNKIIIGHNPICPHCGNTHSETEWCTCYDCREEQEDEYCDDCGERVYDNNSYYINGHTYCRDCTTYCEYHGEREHICEEDMYYVENYGYVCPDGIDEGLNEHEFYECEECGNYIYRGSEVIHEDENTGECHLFCGSYCRDRWLRHDTEQSA